MVTQQLLSSLIQINLKYLINLMLTCSFIIKCLNWLSFSDWFAKSEFYNSLRSIQYMMIRRSRNRCYNWWILCVSYLSRLKHPHVFPPKVQFVEYSNMSPDMTLLEEFITLALALSSGTVVIVFPFHHITGCSTPSTL